MMVLYSGTTCPFSHRCRFVLFEKAWTSKSATSISTTSPKTSMMNPVWPGSDSG